MTRVSPLGQDRTTPPCKGAAEPVVGPAEATEADPAAGADSAAMLIAARAIMSESQSQSLFGNERTIRLFAIISEVEM